MVESRADCVIVGGGIGGAVLALILGRAGKHVVVLERELKPQAGGRPEILARSTIQIFNELGVIKRILGEAAIPLRALEFFQVKNKLLINFGLQDFEEQQAGPHSTNPSATRQILLEAASTTRSVEVMQGVEVTNLTRDNSGVHGVQAMRNDVPTVWRAPLVIGDDGGHSRIREALGIPLRTQDFPLEFLAAAGPTLAHERFDVGEASINPGGLKSGIFGGVFMPQPGNRSAIVFLLSPHARVKLMGSPASEFYKIAGQMSVLCEGLEKNYVFPKDFKVFKRPFGHASSYVSDGAALLGDAVHPVTPIGGQGANMSVADAVVLGRVALEAFNKNDFSQKLLSSYQTERFQANKRSIQFSVRANRILRTLSIFPLAAFLLPWVLERVNQTPKLKQRFIWSVSHAFESKSSLES